MTARELSVEQSSTTMTSLSGWSPVHSLPDGIVETPAAVAPVKTALAFFVSGLLQGIEPLDVVDHGNNALRELLHGCKG
jgi:hypothetical protein